MTDDQRQQWQRADAAAKRQRRTKRGKRKRGPGAVDGPGMIRLDPAQRSRLVWQRPADGGTGDQKGGTP
jgi:hypothetical protein